MTQSNIKYDSRQAGESLFKPQAKGKTFEEGYYRRPIENITNQLEKNKATFLESAKTTRDQTLDNMKTEALQSEVIAKHDAEVEKLNEAYDLEQFTAFSKSAGELVTAYFQHKKDKSVKETYRYLRELQIRDPELYEKYIKNYEDYIEQNKQFSEKVKREQFRAQYEALDLHLAQVLFKANGWERQTVFEATLADRVSNLDYFFKEKQQHKKFSFPQYGIENQTYDEYFNPEDPKNAPDRTDPKFKEIHNTFTNSIIVDLRNDHFLNHNINATLVRTKVDPFLDKLQTQHAKVEYELQTTELDKRYQDLEKTELTNIFKNNSLNVSNDITVSELFKLISRDKDNPAFGETNQIQNSLGTKLEIALKTFEANDPSVSEFDLYALSDGKIYGGTEPGQHKGLTKGKGKTLEELYPKVFADVNFRERIRKHIEAKRGYKLDNQTNLKKAYIAAATDHVRANGPMSEIDRQEFAKSIAAQFGLSSVDVYNDLDVVETQQGLSVQQWVEKFEGDHGDLPLHREDYPLGVPPEAFEQAKDLFQKDPKYYQNPTELNTIQSDLGKEIATKMKVEIIGGVVPRNLYYNAEVNALHHYQKVRQGIINDNKDITPQAAHQKAMSQTFDDMRVKEDGEYVNILKWNGPITKIDRFNKENESVRRQLHGANNRADKIVIKELKDQLEWFAEYEKDMRANGYTGPRSGLLKDRDMMWQPKEGPPLEFHNELFNATAAKVGGMMSLVNNQLKAMKVQDKDAYILPGDVDKPGKYRDPFYWPPLDPSIFKQLDQPKRRNALGNTVQEFVDGKWKPVYKQDGKPLTGKIEETPDIVGQSFGDIDPESFAGALGITEEFFQNRSYRAFAKEFLKTCGIKNSDTCTEEMISALKERIWRLYGTNAFSHITFEGESEWTPIQWNTIGGIK